MWADPENSRITPRIMFPEKGKLNIEFQCSSSEVTKWFYEKKAIPSNSISHVTHNMNYLIIHNVGLHNYGTYQCFGWDSRKENYFIAEGKMIVYGENNDNSTCNNCVYFDARITQPHVIC